MDFTMFLLCFTDKKLRSIHPLSLVGFTWIYLFYQVFTRLYLFYQVLTRLYRLLIGFTGFLLCLSRIYTGLILGLYWVLTEKRLQSIS